MVHDEPANSVDVQYKQQSRIDVDSEQVKDTSHQGKTNKCDLTAKTNTLTEMSMSRTNK